MDYPLPDTQPWSPLGPFLPVLHPICLLRPWRHPPLLPLPPLRHKKKSILWMVGRNTAPLLQKVTLIFVLPTRSPVLRVIS